MESILKTKEAAEKLYNTEFAAAVNPPCLCTVKANFLALFFNESFKGPFQPYWNAFQHFFPFVTLNVFSPHLCVTLAKGVFFL